MVTEPWYIWSLTLAGAVGLPGLTAFALDRSAKRSGSSRLPGALFALGSATWLLLGGFLAQAGWLHPKGGRVAPWFGVAVAGWLAVLLLAAALPPARRLRADRYAVAGLTVPHAVRVVGVVFIVAAALGHLPWLFAVPAGLGDFAVGVTAPGVARRLARDPGASGATRFHLLGIVDLVVALTLGFLCGLGPVHIIPIPPSTVPLSELPLALIPLVAVPTAIALHVAALLRLRAFHRSASDPTVPARSVSTPAANLA